MNIRIILMIVAAGLLAACATSPRYGHTNDPYYQGSRYEQDTRYRQDNRYDTRYDTRCYDCGYVDRIVFVDGRGEATGGGAILGGVVGAAVGNQVGSGSGRKAATVAGAVAGAAAGHEIEKRSRDGLYQIFVRMENGGRVVVEQNQLNGIREGSYVQVRGDSALLVRS